MIMRIVLLLVQVAAAWFGAMLAMPYLEAQFGQLALAPYNIFAFAILFVLIIFLVGLIVSAAMRDVGSPTSGTLVFSLILALIGAGLTLLPAVTTPLLDVLQRSPVPISLLALPLAGAAIGYLIKR